MKKLGSRNKYLCVLMGAQPMARKMQFTDL
uniref:Uncharacterized protein n=1 Tax=Rhizophora mucronata TaxID=61149 RepID=A0A2P2QB38_RHIMU